MEDLDYFLNNYLNYMNIIKGRSKNTIKEYSYDLVNFFRFLSTKSTDIDSTLFENTDYSDLSIKDIEKVKLSDLHSFIAFMDKLHGNTISTRSRKIASLRSFFKYLYDIEKIIKENPAEKLETPKKSERNPVYLTFEESVTLLNTISKEKNEFIKRRDYAIVTLFLNCGLRLSELSSIDLNKIKNKTLTVIGKGNKERTIYLNEVSLEAIIDYLKIRPDCPTQALFLSNRNQRMSNRAIQYRIDKYLKKANFDIKVYSTHKLRHTAATLLYKYGNVDILALKEILGHKNVSTTQIYTHIDDERLREAVSKNPLNKYNEW